MLLPSAIPCDGRSTTPRPSSKHPRRAMQSPSRPAYPLPSTQSANIYNACHALQSLLNSTFTLSNTSARPSYRSLESPIDFKVPMQITKAAKKPPKQRKYPHQSAPTTIAAADPPSRKRRLSSMEKKSLMGEYEDKENAPSTLLSDAAPCPSTPKRNKRRCPPTLPLGLEKEDFDALQTTSTRPHPQRHRRLYQEVDLGKEHAQFQIQPDFNFTSLDTMPFPFCSMASTPTAFTNPPASPATEPDIQNPTDPYSDPALLRLILSKLRLKPSDWDETAQHLGPDSSIDERWQFLLNRNRDANNMNETGSGAPPAVLRRGKGVRRRGSLMDLDMMVSEGAEER